MSKPTTSQNEVPVQRPDWFLRLCAAIVAFILAWGSIISGWLEMPSDIETIKTDIKELSELPSQIETIDVGVKELLEQRAHRIFTVVPEVRTEYSSMNPRVFEVEIPPYAVAETATFEFDQSPVVPLPASLGPGYEYLGWSVAFGPETLELMEPFTARVVLKPEEWNMQNRLQLLYWSKDEIKWDEIPTTIQRDALTGDYLLTFETRDAGLFALSVKSIE